MWWQVRVENDQLVGYKETAANDPLKGIDNTRVTTNWYAAPVLRPENAVTGVSWRHGGYVNAFGYYPAANGWGGYTVVAADHWLFWGTGLRDGNVFGREQTIVGYETDGALFKWVNGKPAVTGAGGTPLNFQILAYAPASVGNATLGIYQTGGGGYVFNASTIEWADGLWSSANSAIANPTVSIITYNAFAALAALPPGNDALAAAYVLRESDGYVNGTNRFATKEAGEPKHAGNSGGASTWFKWTASATGSYTFTTQGSQFDTLLAVYQGTDMAALTLRAANNDDGLPGGSSTVTFNAVAGQSYFIAVDGRNGATGAFTLSWRSPSTSGSGAGEADVPFLPPWAMVLLAGMLGVILRREHSRR